MRQQVREHVRTITKAFGKKLKEPMQVTVKKHERDAHLNLPARPFMTVQPEDWEDIHDILLEHIQGAVGGDA